METSERCAPDTSIPAENVCDRRTSRTPDSSSTDRLSGPPANGQLKGARASIAARLERLEVCAYHRRFVGLISIGSWFEVFDIFVTAYLGAALQSQHFLTLHQFGLVVAAGFVGMYFGTNLIGFAGDRFGRRTAFIGMLVIYSVFSIAGAFSQNAETLISMRFLAGIGIGGQLVIIDTFVSEIVPSRVRGRYIAFSQFASFTSVPAAALATALLVPTHWLWDGWRWVMALGGLGIFASGLLYRCVDESPRWLESVGRHAEAERVMVRIEAAVMRYTAKSLAAVPVVDVAVGEDMPFKELWKPEYRGRTLLLTAFQVLQTVGFYGFANWAPTFLLHSGRNLGQSLGVSFIFALMNPVGPVIGILTTERVERKHALVGLSVLMAATGMMFAYVSGTVELLLVGALLTAFASWFSSIIHAYQAELFPTRARATGIGFTYGWSRLSTVFSTMIISALLVHGILAVFLFISGAMVLAAIVVGLWAPRTNRLTLESISR